MYPNGNIREMYPSGNIHEMYPSGNIRKSIKLNGLPRAPT